MALERVLSRRRGVPNFDTMFGAVCFPAALRLGRSVKPPIPLHILHVPTTGPTTLLQPYNL
eukprot:12901509-Prorocentrum_lima.AAC.1